VLPELFRIFLDGDVGKMYKSIIRILRIDVELIGAGPEISLLANICFSVHIDEHPNPYVKLPLVDEEGPFDVLLNDEAIMLVFWFTVFHHRFELIFRWLLLCWTRCDFLVCILLNFFIAVNFVDGLYLS
jgi:hypothetical protein